MVSKNIFFILMLFWSCVGKQEKIDVNFRSTQSSSSTKTSTLQTFTVSNIQFNNNQFIITGNNLSAVTNFQIKDGTATTTLQIESKTATSLIANTLSTVTLSAGKLLDFVFTSANASATFQVNFSLCNATLGEKAFKCPAIPNDKEVLAYDDSLGKWVPKNVNSLVTLNGLLYKGTWDAYNNYPEPTGSYKDYYIVSVAGNGYSVGDSIIHNGTGWDKIGSSIQTVFGRTGTITGQEGDYELDQLDDVDTSTTAPFIGDYLKYNGTNWVPEPALPGTGTVTNVTATTPLLVSSGTSQPALSIIQATTTTSGYLSSTDWNTFNNKEPAITNPSDTTKYYRGDKSFQTLNTTAVAEGTNLYFTTARAQAAAVADAITNGVTDVAPSQNAVYDALALKLDASAAIAQSSITNLTTDLADKQDSADLAVDVRAIVLTGLSTATNAAIAATDTILAAFGKIQAQINYYHSSLTSVQRLALVSPATGYEVFDTTAGVKMIYNGTRWLEVGSPPIGTITSWHKSFTNTPAIPWGWKECDGSVLSDTESPYHGQTLPNLNSAPSDPAGGAASTYAGGYYLRGSTTSGTAQDDQFQGHIAVPSSTYYWGALATGGPGRYPDGTGWGTLEASIYASMALSSDGTNGTIRTGKETRPVSFTVVYIIRVK